MLQVTEEIKKEFYGYVYELAQSECQQVAEEEGIEYSIEDIEDTLRNIIDDGHPLLYNLVNDLYLDMLGRDLTEDEYEWFLDKGIFLVF